MSRDFGMESEAVTRDSLLGDHPPVMKADTILSGENLPLGAVLAKNSAGQYVGLDLEAAISAESLVADAGGAATTFEGFLAHGGVVPGSVVIHATVGAAAKTLTDNGAGKVSGTAGAGLIDYASGYYRLIFGTAPDDNTAITADYGHDAAGQAVAAGVLLEVMDASGGDEAALVLSHGVVTADDLAWPTDITAEQKARALRQLAAAGIHAL